MAWIDDALPLPSARPIEADEALDAVASTLIGVTAAVAAMQLFTAFVLDRPAETALYAATAASTGAAGFVPLESRARRGALIAGAWASTVVWLAMVPLTHEGAGLAVVLSLAAGCALLARRLAGAGEQTEDRSRDASLDPPAGWIEDHGPLPLVT